MNPRNNRHNSDSKQITQDVDQLLNALGSVPIPDDLEWQILARIKQKPDPQATNRAEDAWLASLSNPGSLSPRWRLVTLALAAVVIAVLLLPHRSIHSRIAPSPKMQMALAVRSSPPAAHQAAASHLSQNAAQSTQAGLVVPLNRHQAAARVVASRQAPESSYPTPPEPLNEQEILLLEIARHPDPALVASLDPKVREAQENRSREEFERFVHGESQ